jgi:hypothetical protein
MHRLSVVLYGTLGSYVRDALQEGGAAVVGLPPCSEGLRFCACFLFVFAGGFHYFLCNQTSIESFSGLK